MERKLWLEIGSPNFSQIPWQFLGYGLFRHFFLSSIYHDIIFFPPRKRENRVKATSTLSRLPSGKLA